MSIFKKTILLLLLLPTVLLVIIPHSTASVASYLTPVTLAVIPITLLNAFLTVWEFHKHSRWTWLFAIAFLVSGWQVSETMGFGISSRKVHSEMFPIRIVSWNVRDFQLKSETLLKASNVLLAEKPDILCFQERPHTNLLAWDTIKAAFPDYPYTAINSREDEVLNLAILSRWPVSGLKEFYFPESYNKIIQADIHIGKQTIRLFNVHLQTTGVTPGMERKSVIQIMQKHALKRNKQAQLLHEAIQSSPYPVLVCGDFNDVPSSFAYTQVSQGLRDCFKEAGYGWGNTYQSLGNLFRIDYMLCAKQSVVTDYNLISNSWSDHKIQCATIYYPSN